MIDKQREKFVAEIHKYEDAIKSTDSVYLKRDYLKKLKRMRKELKEYDNFKYGCGQESRLLVSEGNDHQI